MLRGMPLRLREHVREGREGKEGIMSDCSTNAMKPKEPPKTCGTCANSCGHKARLYGFTCNCVPCLLHGTFKNEATCCSDWKPRTNEWGLTEQDVAIIKLGAENSDLKERFQQLEQVARDALAIISMTCSLTNEDSEAHCVNLNCGKAYESLREQLEALGVSVDG